MGPLLRAGALIPLLPCVALALRPFLVVVDPGHGGRDPGACWRGLREKDLTLRIARRLRGELCRRGILCRLTRESDRYLSPRRRARLARRWGADCFISIHANAAPPGCRRRGASVYVRRPNPLAWEVLRCLRRVTRLELVHPRRAELAVLRDLRVPALLVEVGYIDNPAEAWRLYTARFQRRLVAAIRRAVERCFPLEPLRVHRVRRGDTLWGIARRYGVGVRQLADLNGLRSSRIRPGAELRLPRRCGRGVHRVRRGDTLWGIARRYGVGVRQLADLNGLRSSRIMPGRRLIIP